MEVPACTWTSIVVTDFEFVEFCTVAECAPPWLAVESHGRQTEQQQESQALQPRGVSKQCVLASRRDRRGTPPIPISCGRGECGGMGGKDGCTGDRQLQKGLIKLNANFRFNKTVARFTSSRKRSQHGELDAVELWDDVAARVPDHDWVLKHVCKLAAVLQDVVAVAVDVQRRHLHLPEQARTKGREGPVYASGTTRAEGSSVCVTRWEGGFGVCNSQRGGRVRCVQVQQPESDSNKAPPTGNTDRDNPDAIRGSLH
eukprot:357000-Chlamydomonas_euryale.AAC.4